MFHVHGMSYGYVMNINFIFPSHSDDEDMFMTLRRWGYVCHIATIWLFLSHCNGGAKFMTLQWHDMCVTLWWQDICATLHDGAMFIALQQ